jgi:hypothetical protein
MRLNPETVPKPHLRKAPRPPIVKLIPYESDLALTDRIWTLKSRMSLIPKRKEVSETGSGITSTSFIFNNMAERVGFESGL